MKRTVTIIVVAAIVIVVAALGFATWFVIQGLDAFRAGSLSSPTSSYKDVQVRIPTEANRRTVAVFNFKPEGDADAKYYAIGFARALSDRLHCAPTAVTQQVTWSEIARQLIAAKHGPASSPSDEVALKLGRKMGVAWVVTGKFTLAQAKAEVRLRLLDTQSGKCKAEYTAEKPLNELPSVQAMLTSDLVKGMDVRPDKKQLAELAKPNFSKPETLASYGRAYFAKSDAESEALRWRSYDSDPGASFPALRLMEYYHYSCHTIPELQSNKRLQALLQHAERQFPRNSHMRVMKGLLLADQCKYADAQSYLQRLTRDDPDFVRAHTALGRVGHCREDGDLAVAELTRAVDLWPNNPYLHAGLASAYGLASNNTRRGNYHSDMGWSRSRKWRDYCNRQLEQAVVAVKMDKDCSDGWAELLNVSLQLGRYADRDTAYQEMVRIDPADIAAYEAYARCFIPQWGGNTGDLDRICSQAEAAFGKDAVEVCALRANVLSYYPRETCDYKAVLQAAEAGLRKCKAPGGNLLYLKSLSLLHLGRVEDAQATALQGVSKWNTLDWRMQLARCYAMRWEHGRDRQSLDRAAEIYGERVHEMPNNIIGRLQYGWCLSHQGHRAEAKAQFLKGLELDPGNEVLKDKLQYVQ